MLWVTDISTHACPFFSPFSYLCAKLLALLVSSTAKMSPTMAMWSHTSQALRERARRTAAHRTQTYQGCLPAVNAGSFIIIIDGAGRPARRVLNALLLLELRSVGSPLVPRVVSCRRHLGVKGWPRCRVCRVLCGRGLGWVGRLLVESEGICVSDASSLPLLKRWPRANTHKGRQAHGGAICPEASIRRGNGGLFAHAPVR